ncbi:MAG: ABC transporter permease [Proteobacteria bacterium]|nr:ABC transporter permease [Pseudomonadota bacterium]
MKPSFLFKLSISYSKGHPLQKFLLFLGIAIGVAVVVAVDLANESIGRSFQLSTQSISGRATHQIVGSSDTLEQSFYVGLKKKVADLPLAPVVSGYVQLVQHDNRTMQLLGIDPFVDTSFRNYLGSASSLPNQDILVSILTQPGRVLISKDLADELKLNPGDSLDLQTNRGTQKVVITGLLNSSDSFTREALSGVILTDISSAQEILVMGERISHIDMIVDPEDSESLAVIESNLSGDARIVSVQKNANTVRQMSNAFELNLRALSLLALLVGVFLIYNTITFSVVQRRAQIGTLRALGVTRQEIFGLIQVETLFWGMLGSFAGLLLGIALGTSIIKLISQTISDLYFVLTVNTFYLNAWQFLKAFLLGILASVISAAFPAWEAAHISPVDALRRSSLERKISRNLALLTTTGLLLLVIGYLLLLVPTTTLGVSYLALLAIVCGSAMLVPVLTKVIMKVIGVLFRIFPGIIGRMSSRNISRSLSRTGGSIASLMIAISVIIGVGNMVGSFRSTVVSWLSNTIQADLYISPASHLSRKLDNTLKDAIQQLPGVEEVYSIQTRQIRFGDYANSSIVSLDRDVAKRTWIWRSGDDHVMEQKFNQGWVFISEPFAFKHGIQGKKGSVLMLETSMGPQEFRLAGIFRDFSSEQGIIIMQDNTFRRFWGDDSVFGVSLFIREGASVDKVRKEIEREFGAKHKLVIRSNKGLREAAIEVFDRTFTITIALQILAGLVAFIGVLNTIMSLMLERSREIGTLRANGMTINQLWRLVFTESGFIGLLSGLFAIPLGTAMAWILVFVINKRSFGWTLDFVLNPGTYMEALVIALTAALLAGIYPVVAMLQKPVAELLRTE